MESRTNLYISCASSFSPLQSSAQRSSSTSASLASRAAYSALAVIALVVVAPGPTCASRAATIRLSRLLVTGFVPTTILDPRSNRMLRSNTATRNPYPGQYQQPQYAPQQPQYSQPQYQQQYAPQQQPYAQQPYPAQPNSRMGHRLRPIRSRIFRRRHRNLLKRSAPNSLSRCWPPSLSIPMRCWRKCSLLPLIRRR